MEQSVGESPRRSIGTPYPNSSLDDLDNLHSSTDIDCYELKRILLPAAQLESLVHV